MDDPKVNHDNSARLAPPGGSESVVRKEHQRWPREKWRTTVATGAVIALTVLIANIGILVWARSQHTFEDGIAVLYEGDCTQTKRVQTWSSLGINILSTLLLSASNNCMQCLTSPTRAEIDSAHAAGTWLDVGVLSMRNLRMIRRVRTLLFLFLCLSSIPLHLL
jgi:hypothetical protein